MAKYIIKQISLDGGKTWSDAHFIDETKYPAPEIHPTGGLGYIIKPIKTLATPL